MILRLLLLLVTAAIAPAATFTATVTIPDAIATQVLASVDAWRLKQLKPDETLRYSSRAKLASSLLRKALMNILVMQCMADSEDCLPQVQSRLDGERDAALGRSAAADGLIDDPLVP